MENWDAVLWILVRFAILSLVIERALYVVFEWALFEKLESILDSKIGIWFDVKPAIAIAVSVLAIAELDIDLIAALFATPATTAGLVLTGLYVAGGSKAVFMMFDRFRELREAKATAEITKVLKSK